MVTRFKQQTIKSIKVEFSEEPVTAWGGLALTERVAMRLGLWRALEKKLPARPGARYAWLETLKTAVAGLLSGARGTYATQAVRHDRTLLRLLGVAGAPEEATLWRLLAALGRGEAAEALNQAQSQWAKRVLAAAPRRDLLVEGWAPVFGDGELSEGSRRREGTKYIQDKGHGLLWTTWMVGPVVAAERLVRQGQGETASLMGMLPEVVDQVLKPLKLKDKAVVLMDSLHGDGPTLDKLQAHGLRYVVGANKLTETERILSEQPEEVWQPTGPRPELDWAESAACVCWIQCADWEDKRVLVGRRWRRQGEFLYHYRGVMTNLSRNDVAGMKQRGMSFAQAVWRLYDHKAAMENHFKELLEDLGLHHPPCRELDRNQGFYALATLAHTLGRAVDLIGGASPERGSRRRADGGQRRRPRPRSMRLWRLRRRLLALPARITTHARQATVRLLGADPVIEKQFRFYWGNICRC